LASVAGDLGFSELTIAAVLAQSVQPFDREHSFGRSLLQPLKPSAL
jgi:hypothetical protein